jgi:MFS family permease
MRRLFVLVAAVILVDTMFYAAIVPLLPEYTDDLGLSKPQAGILSASYAAGTLLAALPSGFLAARVGVRPTMLAGLALLSASSIVFAFADQVVLLDLARFAQGVGGACAWTGGLAWLLAAGPRERRGELVGSVLAVAIAGILLGPVIGGAATVIGPEPVFAAVGALAAALAAAVFASSGVGPEEAPRLRRVVASILTGPVMLAFWLVALPSILAGLVDVLAPLRLDDLGASGVTVGAVFLVSAAIEATISPTIGRFSDRRGRMSPIRAGLVASALAATLPAVPGSVIGVGVAVVVVFLAMSLIWTPSMALLSDDAEAAGLDLAFATALVSFAWAGGQVLGGSAVVALADGTSDALAYGLVGIAFALTLLSLHATGTLRVGARAPSG